MIDDDELTDLVYVITSRANGEKIYSNEVIENIIKKRIKMLEERKIYIEKLSNEVLILGEPFYKKYDTNDGTISKDLHIIFGEISMLRVIIEYY